MLKINAVSKTINDLKILDSISCDLDNGQIVALLGPSGSGKSTLLRCLSRLTSLSAGKILYNGTPIEALAPSKIGVVFQSFNLFPHMTAEKNLTYAPVKLKQMAESETKNRAVQLLEQFGLSDKKDLYPGQLSGGQKQRVAIARALMMDPDILLFDEPTSALDPEMVEDVAQLILKSKRGDRLIIMATHELKICKLIADHILFLNQGKLVENCGTTQFFNAPTSARAKTFIDKMKV
ncbi:amino acid ABC transporter ATP-binding protein [Candidatus Paracaedibacter symbiosus]|uniref:amino acid ABC transporter ATP-binding protein n=1 Tax=Candidatus Paracaedibacter symbiosus TaxID=244582 RepID=UPI0005096D42|nr:amino acid ABC transporter ATP-binding protein [Candidatus Paracaedibacter symbiosus]